MDEGGLSAFDQHRIPRPFKLHKEGCWAPFDRQELVASHSLYLRAMTIRFYYDPPCQSTHSIALTKRSPFS